MGNACGCPTKVNDNQFVVTDHDDEYRPLNTQRKEQLRKIDLIVKIQSLVRGFIARKKFKVMKNYSKGKSNFQPSNF